MEKLAPPATILMSHPTPIRLLRIENRANAFHAGLVQPAVNPVEPGIPC